ncbi:MAG: hypothetical protein ABJZ55_15845 [Fuerstiella sp.]
MTDRSATQWQHTPATKWQYTPATKWRTEFPATKWRRVQTATKWQRVQTATKWRHVVAMGVSPWNTKETRAVSPEGTTGRIGA